MPSPAAEQAKVTTGRSGSKKSTLSTSARIFSADISGTQTDYTTTKAAAEANMMCSPSVQRVQLPTLYPGKPAIHAALDTYMPGGEPPADIAYTLGQKAVQEDTGGWTYGGLM